MHLRAETGQDLYPAAQRIFFGGLLVGVVLAVLSRRVHNGPGVFQAFAQFAFAAGVALALPAIGELTARTAARGLYVAAMLFSVAAWWTIRNVTAAPASLVDARSAAAGTSVAEAGRWKRISAYVLVSLDLVGLLIFVIAAVAMWMDRPRRTPQDVTLFVALLTIGPWMLSLILFGWIAEVRLCWILGLATLVPLLLLTIAGTIDASTPFALSTLAGLAVAAFAVETLRRLRKEPLPGSLPRAPISS
jgi:hypothetical protein